jgi:hypothetical protein
MMTLNQPTCNRKHQQTSAIVSEYLPILKYPSLVEYCVLLQETRLRNIRVWLHLEALTATRTLLSNRPAHCRTRQARNHLVLTRLTST